MNSSEITMLLADELPQQSSLNGTPSLQSPSIQINNAESSIINQRRRLSDNPAAIKKRMQRAAHSEEQRQIIRSNDAERKKRARFQESSLVSKCKVRSRSLEVARKKST